MAVKLNECPSKIVSKKPMSNSESDLCTSVFVKLSRPT